MYSHEAAIVATRDDDASERANYRLPIDDGTNISRTAGTVARGLERLSSKHNQNRRTKVVNNGNILKDGFIGDARRQPSAQLVAMCTCIQSAVCSSSMAAALCLWTVVLPPILSLLRQQTTDLYIRSCCQRFSDRRPHPAILGRYASIL